MSDAGETTRPGEADRLRRFARGAYKQGDYDTSIRSFSLLVGLPLEEGNAARAARAQDEWDLSTVLIRMGRTEEAVAPLQRALELTPADPRVLTKLGQVLSRLERREEAAELFRRLVEVAPHDADGHAFLAGELRWLGRTEEARASIDRALELDPDHIDARLTLMALEASSGTRIEIAMEETLEQVGGDVRLLYLREAKPPSIWMLAIQAVILAIAALWVRHLFP